MHYGNMVAIMFPPLSFHTVGIDFIVALPASGLKRFISILTVTDKFSKGKLLIPGWKDMLAKKIGGTAA